MQMCISLVGCKAHDNYQLSKITLDIQLLKIHFTP